MDADKVSVRRLVAALHQSPGVFVVALILLGLALRLGLLLGEPLHQDEALYGFWGRLISSGQDPWLATAAVDKPPLALYLIAGSQATFGVSEFVLRLPGLAASLLAIPLTFVLGRRLYGLPDHRDAGRGAFSTRPQPQSPLPVSRCGCSQVKNRHGHGGWIIGVVAAAVMALTPFPVLFGATAFTDPILVAWWLAACCAAVSGRWGWAGLLLGLAFATKQQAVVLAPLTVGLGVVSYAFALDHLHRAADVCGPQSNNAVQVAAQSGGWRVASSRFALGLALVVVGVFAWDAFRIVNVGAMGFWGQGVESYGGLRLIWPGELGPRLCGWTRLGGYLLGWPWLGLFFLVVVGALLGRDLVHRRRAHCDASRGACGCGQVKKAALADVILIAFALGYFFFHWLVAFPVWDRYLLPLTPVVALLVGRVASGVLSCCARWRGTFHVSCFPRRFAPKGGTIATFYALLLLSLASSGLMAASGDILVGGDHGAYDGLGEVVDYVRALPVGTVLYDRWLSWHYDFYLFDAYLYRAGFPTPEWLATDAATFYDGQPRYLVIPDWESSTRLERALSEVGLAMSPVLTTSRRDGSVSFIVYQIGSESKLPASLD